MQVTTVSLRSSSSAYGTIEIRKYPWRIVLKDKDGRTLTETRTLGDNDSTQVKILPFNFIKRGSDNSRSINPVFSLAPQERIYGCGESFTSLNKVGHKVNIFVTVLAHSWDTVHTRVPIPIP